MPKFNHKGLYAILDSKTHQNYGLNRLLTQLVKESQIPVIQLRLKSMARSSKIEILQQAFQLKSERDFTIILNDDIYMIDDKPLDGFHLGQTDMAFGLARTSHPEHILGLSTHNINQAKTAQSLKADYIGCGAVFPTESKIVTENLGLTGLKAIVDSVDLPTIAIGGIHENNIESVAHTGCDMAACISALIKGNKFSGQKLHESFLNHQP